MLSLNIGARSLRVGQGYAYYQGKRRDIYLSTTDMFRFSSVTYQSFNDSTTEVHIGLLMVEFSRKLR